MILRSVFILVMCLAGFLIYAEKQSSAVSNFQLKRADKEVKSTCSISYVYDGDTVKIDCGSGEEKARLVGFDTPETRDAACAEEKAHGLKAKARLGQLIDQAKSIEADRKGTDKYHRGLYELRLDGAEVGATLVSEGLAAPYGWGGKIDWCDKLRSG